MALPTPYSHRTYAATGGAQTLAVPFPFVARSHVRVFVNWLLSDDSRESELLPDIGFEWINDASIRIQAVASGKSVSVVRRTPIDQQVVAWQAGSPPTAYELSAADRQVFYVVQEWLDRVSGIQDDINVIIDEGISVSVIDNLTSDQTAAALSAKQGKNLKSLYDSLAQTVENILEEGVGPAVTIVDNLTSTDATKALSAKQGKALADMSSGLDQRLDVAEGTLTIRNTRAIATAQVSASSSGFVTGTISLAPCSLIESISLSRKGSLALYSGVAGLNADAARPFLTEAPDNDVGVIVHVRLEQAGSLPLGIKMVAMSDNGGASFPFRLLNEGPAGSVDITITYLPFQVATS